MKEHKDKGWQINMWQGVFLKKWTLIFQTVTSDAEAQNLKNNMLILMSHLGAHLAVPGFLNILQGQTR